MSTKKISKKKIRKIQLKNETISLDNQIESLQSELELIQQAYLKTGDRAVIVLQGLDAAGKGGLIRRIAWAMDPRSFRVWPIKGPNEQEKRQHYLQRFWDKMPASSEIVVFDRSWYGRVLDERVEKLCNRDEWKRAYREINEFESQLTAAGFRVIKIFLAVSRAEQLKRFEGRINNPGKRWKLTYEDFRNRDNWSAYQVAVRDMIDRTSSRQAPWHWIDSDSKPKSRVQALQIIIDDLKRGVNLRPPAVSAEIRKLAIKAGLKLTGD